MNATNSRSLLRAACRVPVVVCPSRWKDKRREAHVDEVRHHVAHPPGAGEGGRVPRGRGQFTQQRDELGRHGPEVQAACRWVAAAGGAPPESVPSARAAAGTHERRGGRHGAGPPRRGLDLPAEPDLELERTGKPADRVICPNLDVPNVETGPMNSGSSNRLSSRPAARGSCHRCAASWRSPDRSSAGRDRANRDWCAARCRR